MIKYQEPLDSPEKQAAALNSLALTLFFAHRLEELELRANEAVAAAKRAGSEELRLQTTALMSLKHLCYGELDEGRPMLDELVETARALNRKATLAAGLIWRGCLYFFQTEYKRALEVEIEGRQLASELRDGFLLLTSMFFLGLSKANLGQMSEALEFWTRPCGWPGATVICSGTRAFRIALDGFIVSCRISQALSNLIRKDWRSATNTMCWRRKRIR